MGDFKLMRVDVTVPCTAAVVFPEWALEERDAVDAARQRSATGRLTTVQWSRAAAFDLPLKRVPEDVATLLRDWWAQDAHVAFTLDTSHARSTVVCGIANAQAPLPDRAAPETDRWSGMFHLVARYPGGRCGQPFILDDPVFGQLDQSPFTLVEE
ncbi:MAG TPA: hypothetical protein VF678_00030 [bacterium]